jgi:hypothetical protein
VIALMQQGELVELMLKLLDLANFDGYGTGHGGSGKLYLRHRWLPLFLYGIWFSFFLIHLAY